MKAAIMGFGTVGAGIAEILKTNASAVSSRAGEPVELKYILDIRDFPDSPFGKYITHNFDDIVNDGEVSVVCETIGGAKIAYEYTVKCLKAGKSVVTSNKELVATHGPELLKLAYDNGVSYRFEASVGGGIPIIRSLYDSLAGNEIVAVKGILNGTTNYILTNMINNGVTMETALADAQKKGYAERNPSADIDGIDVCRKIAILSSISFGKYVNPDLINTKGIRDITLDDVNACAERNSVLKLIGKASLDENGKLAVRVGPSVIGKDDPLSNVEGVFNGITVTGNALGDVMFYGQGAGKLPTASAVVADVIECVGEKGGSGRLWNESGSDFVIPFEEQKERLLVRFENVSDDFEAKISDYAEKGSIIRKKGTVSFIASENTMKRHIEKISELGKYGKAVSRLYIGG